jgi:hypothetical protein
MQKVLTWPSRISLNLKEFKKKLHIRKSITQVGGGAVAANEPQRSRININSFVLEDKGTLGCLHASFIELPLELQRLPVHLLGLGVLALAAQH